MVVSMPQVVSAALHTWVHKSTWYVGRRIGERRLPEGTLHQPCLETSGAGPRNGKVVVSE